MSREPKSIGTGLTSTGVRPDVCPGSSTVVTGGAVRSFGRFTVIGMTLEARDRMQG